MTASFQQKVMNRSEKQIGDGLAFLGERTKGQQFPVFGNRER